MGTPTNPLSGDAGQDQQGTAQAPNEAAPPSGKLDESMATLRLAEEVGGLAKDVKELVALLKETAEETKAVYDTAAASAEELVEATGTVRDRLRAIVAVSKKFNQNMTIGDATKQVQKMKAEVESLLKSSKANSAEFLYLSRIQRGLVSDEQELLKHHKDANKTLKSSADLMKLLQGSMHNLQDGAIKFAGALNSVNVGKLNKTVMSISGVLGKGGGRIADLKRQAQNAHEVKLAREDKTEENKKTFAKRKAAIEEDIARTMGSSLFDSKGDIDQDKFNKSKQARNIAVDTLTAGTNGEKAGWLDRKLTSMAITGEGGLSEKLMGHVAAGGGSAVEGLIGGGEGLLAGGVTKLAGGAGIIIAAGEALKDTFNAVAKQSKEMEKDLGKGGIFSGKGGGLEGMMNAKDNLRAWGMNRFGVTTERNMAVAQAMQESGVNISGLANKGTGLRDSGVGDIADIAMKQARELGLTDVEGTKQTLKMLQNYKMTLDGTQTFFRTVGKDITAAGLSTGKYLELIDDVTSQFDDMAKSIESVTTILRAMGNTGTETYQQLKENFTDLLGKPQTDEQSLFGMSTMSNAGFQKYAQSQQDVADMQIKKYKDNIYQAVNAAGLPQGSGDQIFKGLDLNKSEGLEEARSRFEAINKANGGKTNAYSTNIGPLLMQAENAMTTAAGVKSGRFNAATVGDVTDANALSKINSTLNTLNNVFAGAGSSGAEFMADPNAALAKNPLLLKKLSETEGIDQHKFMGMRGAVSDISDSIVDELHDGLDESITKNMTPTDREAIYEKYATMAGVKFKPGEAEKTFRNTDAFQLKKNFREAMIQPGALVSEMGDTAVNKSYTKRHTESLETMLKNNADLAMGTRTTNEYLDSIEGALISKAGFLQNIFNIMDKKWGLNADVKGVSNAKEIATSKQAVSDSEILNSIVTSIKPDKSGTNWNWTDPAAGGAAKGHTASDIQKHLQTLEPLAAAGTLDEQGRKDYAYYQAARAEMVNDFKMQMTGRGTYAGRLAEQNAEKTAGLSYSDNKVVSSVADAVSASTDASANNPVAANVPKVDAPAPTTGPSKVNSDNTNNNYQIIGTQQAPKLPATTAMPVKETPPDTAAPQQQTVPSAVYGQHGGQF